MAYSDVHFDFLRGGSTATSAATSHRILGTYGGLSDLHSRNVVSLWLSASTGQAEINPAAAATTQAGILLSPSALVQMEPMWATCANAAEMIRIGTNNPVVYWAIWSKRDL